MKDFRDGIRKDPVMWNMVASLDDATISALAKYYASKKLP
jgi:cytochrome c553